MADSDNLETVFEMQLLQRQWSHCIKRLDWADLCTRINLFRMKNEIKLFFFLTLGQKHCKRLFRTQEQNSEEGRCYLCIYLTPLKLNILVCEQDVGKDMVIHVIKVAVLECLGHCNKLPQTGQLVNNKCVFITGLKNGSPRSECHHVWIDPSSGLQTTSASVYFHGQRAEMGSKLSQNSKGMNHIMRVLLY